MSTDSKSKRFVIDKARLSFNWLTTGKPVKYVDPVDKVEKVRMEYSGDLIIPNDAPQLALCKKMAKEVMQEKWNGKKPANYVSPFITGEERLTKEGNVRPEYVGTHVLRCKNKFRPPGLLDENRQKVLSEEVFYPGCYVAVEVTCFTWGPNNGKVGISFGLEQVMKIGDGERLGSVSSPEAFKDVMTMKGENSALLADDDDDELGV